MGCYMYINECDQKSKRKVEDKDVNDLFQEALQYDKSLMISEHFHIIRKPLFYKNKEVKLYTIYHEVFNNYGKSMFEAREQFSGSGKKEVTMAYLYGIINGYNKAKDEINKL